MIGNDRRYYLSRPSAPPIEEFLSEISPIWDNRMFTNVGEKYKMLVSLLTDRANGGNITLTANGHLALELALFALDIKGKVVTTPFTFASTVTAILRSGLTPVFCDIDEDTLCMDPHCVSSHIDGDTSALLPVHLFGNACDTYSLDRIAEEHGIKVIYDGAQAFGMKIDGRDIALFGDATMFSFHAVKVFHTIEGGAVFFKDSSVRDRADVIRNFGLVGDECTECGFNGKMTEISAAMGICNLKYLDENISRRRECVKAYESVLRDASGIRLMTTRSGVESNYGYMPIRVIKDECAVDRDLLFDRLMEKNIFTRKYYSNLACDWSFMKDIIPPSDVPVARRVSKEILALPLHQDMTADDARYIAKTVKDILKG